MMVVMRKGGEAMVAELDEALAEMKATQRKGGFAYKQAKARYERMVRRVRMGLPPTKTRKSS